MPERKYFIAAIVDVNGSGKLEVDTGTGEPTEPVGVYPEGAEGPYLIDFASDKNVYISIRPGGGGGGSLVFHEDFEDWMPDNWMWNDSRWRITSYPTMYGTSTVWALDGWNSYDRPYAYYNQVQSDFYFRADLVRVADSALYPGPEMGVFFRTQNPWEIQWEGTNFSGYVLAIDMNGNWGNEINTIEVDCWGDTI